MDQAKLDKLERLQKLRESGALTQAEFENGKRRMLADNVAPLARRRWPNYALTAVIVVGASIAIALWVTRDVGKRPMSSPVTQQRTVPVTQTTAPPPIKSAAERLVEAFEAATGHRAAFTRKEGEDFVTTKPVRLVPLPFGLALLTTREIKDGCHGCAGAVGIYYLKDSMEVTGRWPKAVEGWGWGAPPTEWYVTDKFTTYPAIYAEGGYTGQGITCGGATITELRPTGPVESEVIRTYFSNEGALTDDRITAGDKVEELEGKIADIQKNVSFEVRVTGTDRFTEKYVRRGARFVPVVESRLSC